MTRMSREPPIPQCSYCEEPGYFGFGSPKYGQQMHTCSDHRDRVQNSGIRDKGLHEQLASQQPDHDPDPTPDLFNP